MLFRLSAAWDQGWRGDIMTTPDNISSTAGYTALTIVSPLMFGDDSKDQDRACWDGLGQVGCVCDGVSSSPDSAEAARLVTLFAPALFNGNTHERLAMLCDLLMIQRRQCQDSDTVSFPEGTTPAMQDILRKVVKQKRADSFQTTVIAARFITEEKVVLADVIKCGDSAFFAFTKQGQLLTSSLAFPSNLRSDKEQNETPSAAKNIYFGPGDEILIRIEGQLCQYPDLADQAEIRAEHTKNWLVCAPVDGSDDDDKTRSENLLELKVLSLRSTDRLLVPRYLYGNELTCRNREYRSLRYSSAIRPVFTAESLASIIRFAKRGSSTLVLPDHFYCDCFDSFQDSFPLQTQFILCSDGFYSCFSNWQQLWTWLQENAVGLNDDNQRETILKQLHADLHAKSSDDDISFIWVQPNTEGSD